MLMRVIFFGATISASAMGVLMRVICFGAMISASTTGWPMATADMVLGCVSFLSLVVLSDVAARLHVQRLMQTSVSTLTNQASLQRLKRTKHNSLSTVPSATDRWIVVYLYMVLPFGSARRSTAAGLCFSSDMTPSDMR